MTTSPNIATLWPPLQSAPLQALDDLFQWIECTLEITSNALDKLKANKAAVRALQTPPTLAKAQANVAALQEVFHMTRPQVRSVGPSVLRRRRKRVWDDMQLCCSQAQLCCHVNECSSVPYKNRARPCEYRI